MTRDTYGWACKGNWFEVAGDCGYINGSICNDNDQSCNGNCKIKKSYNIYKDPITDDGTKKSLKGLCAVYQNPPDHKTHPNLIWCGTEVTPEEEKGGLLQVIYEDGKFYNQTTLTEIRERINSLVKES